MDALADTSIIFGAWDERRVAAAVEPIECLLEGTWRLCASGHSTLSHRASLTVLRNSFCAPNKKVTDASKRHAQKGTTTPMLMYPGPLVGIYKDGSASARVRGR